MTTTPTEPFRATVLLFDGVEELDAIGPWEVLRMWQTITERDVTVRTASLDGAPVRCGMGLAITPDGAIDQDGAPDLLVHPGGHGTRPLETDAAHLERLRALASTGTLMASVCTGSQVYAAAGLLDGLPATSHWGVLDELRQSHPEVDVRADQRWVDAGQVVTSAGVSAGIDMALHLVERLEDAAVAASVARAMEYRWTPGADGSTPSARGGTSGQGS